MARPKPQSVQQLADTLCIPLVDILLPCRFCHRFLAYIELIAFDRKCLQLIWTEEDLVYACCTSCAFATAQFEFGSFYEYSVSGREIEEIEQKPIGEIVIRCKFCLKLLDLIEKLETCYKQQQFHKVRRNWKGLCRHCGSIG